MLGSNTPQPGCQWLVIFLVVTGWGVDTIDVYFILILLWSCQVCFFCIHFSQWTISIYHSKVGINNNSNNNNNKTCRFFLGGRLHKPKKIGASCYARSLDVKQQPLDQFALWLSWSKFGGCSTGPDHLCLGFLPNRTGKPDREMTGDDHVLCLWIVYYLLMLIFCSKYADDAISVWKTCI